MAIVEAHGLTKAFDGFTAVSGLSLEVAEGEVFGFLGPNGAGKTTTIRMLAGIIAPTSGHAVVAGLRPDLEPENLHQHIGLLTENPGFYNRLSARFNLGFFAGFYSGFDIDHQVEKYLRMMGLWERREDKVGTFSKGMKQRLALVRALLHQPKVLFLDEPTAGLDPEAAHEVRDMIQELSVEGQTVFLSTHNLVEAELLCHRIGVVRTELLALDTPENLRRSLFRRQVVVELENPNPTLVSTIAGLPFVQKIEQAGNQFRLELTDPEVYRPELVKDIVEAGGRIMSVSEERHSLEDIYLSLVREEENSG
ncbi:MAG: ABC transporter ATP-binding protein [Dehalococcoidales bacterium]|nr:MAG: ABC transporter ATP-binding protein [Dehalococcoidales bacterium]